MRSKPTPFSSTTIDPISINSHALEEWNLISAMVSVHLIFFEKYIKLTYTEKRVGKGKYDQNTS